MSLIQSKLEKLDGSEKSSIILNKMFTSNVMMLNIFMEGLLSGEINFKVQLLQLFVLFGSQAYACFDNKFLSE